MGLFGAYTYILELPAAVEAQVRAIVRRCGPTSGGYWRVYREGQDTHMIGRLGLPPAEASRTFASIGTGLGILP